MEIYVDFNNEEIFVRFEEAKEYCLEDPAAGFYDWLDTNIQASEIWNFSKENKDNILIEYIEENFGYRKID